MKRLLERFGRVAVHRVTHQVLRRTGLIKIKPTEIFADQAENHELNPGKKYDTSQNGRNADGYIFSDPKLVDQDRNQCDDAETGSEQTDINRNSQWLDRKIQKHVQPQSNQLTQCIARWPALADAMFHRNLADVSRHPINQSIGVGIRAAIFDNFVDQKTIHHFEAREIKILRFVQHQGRDPIVKTTAEISEPGMFLLDIM